jgi:undecaprenyl-diphosphatase
VETFLKLEGEVVAWLNQRIGRSAFSDGAGYLVVSDYFIPLTMSFWMLGLWFSGKGPGNRERNQRAVLAAAISLGFANLVVLILNQHIFRERPFTQYDLATLFYQPTDSSFPSNPAAVAFAVATAVWLGNRRAASLLFCMAVLWSFARVYSGLFYPSDIVAGGLIGATVACLVTLGLRHIEPVPTWVLRGARLLHLA